MSPNAPIAYNENVHIAAMGQRRGRAYVRVEEIDALARHHFAKTGRGITFADLILAGLVTNKPSAQLILKRRRQDNTLFTYEDRKPQMYYPTSMRAKVIEDLSKKALVGPTESERQTRAVSEPLAGVLGLQKERNFLQVLLASSVHPLEMHGIHMHSWINDSGIYGDIMDDMGKNKGPKSHLEHVGRRNVTFTLAKTGRLVIHIACSQSAFPMRNGDDVAMFFVFMGQVYDRLLYWLKDPRERFTPEPLSWILKCCDLNKDVTINGAEQVTLPDLQLWHAGRVFRAYVKTLDSQDASYRTEGTDVPDQTLIETLDNIVHPYKKLQCEIAGLRNEITYLRIALK
jgi:hypothetical protein